MDSSSSSSPEKLLTISLAKLATSRSSKSGMKLHKTLLLSQLMERARIAYTSHDDNEIITTDDSNSEANNTGNVHEEIEISTDINETMVVAQTQDQDELNNVDTQKAANTVINESDIAETKTAVDGIDKLVENDVFITGPESSPTGDGDELQPQEIRTKQFIITQVNAEAIDKKSIETPIDKLANDVDEEVTKEHNFNVTNLPQHELCITICNSRPTTVLTQLPSNQNQETIEALGETLVIKTVSVIKSTTETAGIMSAGTFVSSVSSGKETDSNVADNQHGLQETYLPLTFSDQVVPISAPSPVRSTRNRKRRHAQCFSEEPRPKM